MNILSYSPKCQALNLLGVGPEVMSVAFQVLRNAALKQKEGQYFTPQPVVAAAVRALDIGPSDLILDPACGTGGFLVEAMAVMQENVRAAGGDSAGVIRWAQKALHGIDKDPIAIKLTKAVMQIMGDGSANCARGDSVATHLWQKDFPHLPTVFKDERFSVIFTNPPFGAPLKVKRSEAIKAHLTIAKAQPEGDVELGLAMLERCYQLLRPDGRLCIVLPETYFFSPSYKFVRDWCKGRFIPEVVINVPMEAFAGFCRAKTNVYIFRKAGGRTTVSDKNVVLLNPKTCGVYKNGAVRYKVTQEGQRTAEIDNQMLEHVLAWRSGGTPAGMVTVSLEHTRKRDVLVPTYYDGRYNNAFEDLKARLGCDEISLKELVKGGYIAIRGGHGSPSNDVRVGSVPYVKVSDIRSLRVNVNPSNFIPRELAQKSYWRSAESGLRAWDLITPNRASNNIGEFAVLLPGEEQIVLTKEMFVVRVTEQGSETIDPFYLLWALSLKAVRDQWRRVTLMQTNREDVGQRHLEVRIPWPRREQDAASWCRSKSASFRNYFEGIAGARASFVEAVQAADDEFIGSVYVASVSAPLEEDEPNEGLAVPEMTGTSD